MVCDEKQPLEPTASLVMEWSKPFYNTQNLTAKFLQFFDLSSGKSLVEQCRKVSDLAPFIVMNRKYWFEKQIKNWILKSREEPVQVLILAAGKTPLALQMADTFSREQLSGIYEVDVSSFRDKEKIYQSFCCSDRIKCLELSILNPLLLEYLIKKDFDPKRKTIIILEGITYYLLEKDLQSLLDRFINVLQNTGYVLLDYKEPLSQEVTRQEQGLHQVFDIIKKECSLSFITEYTQQQLKKMLHSLSNKVEFTFLCDIEKQRTNGKESLFKRKDHLITFAQFELCKTGCCQT